MPGEAGVVRDQPAELLLLGEQARHHVADVQRADSVGLDAGVRESRFHGCRGPMPAADVGLLADRRLAHADDKDVPHSPPLRTRRPGFWCAHDRKRVSGTPCVARERQRTYDRGTRAAGDDGGAGHASAVDRVREHGPGARARLARARPHRGGDSSRRHGSRRALRSGGARHRGERARRRAAVGLRSGRRRDRGEAEPARGGPRRSRAGRARLRLPVDRRRQDDGSARGGAGCGRGRRARDAEHAGRDRPRDQRARRQLGRDARAARALRGVARGGRCDRVARRRGRHGRGHRGVGQRARLRAS